MNYLLPIVALFLLNCSRNEEMYIPSKVDPKCYITEFDKTPMIINGQQFYTSKFTYDKKNNVMARLTYGIEQVGQSENGYPIYDKVIKSTTNIIYNNKGLASSIAFQPDDFNKTQIVEELTYNNNLLIEKNILSKDLKRNIIMSSKNFLYNYDNKNRINLVKEVWYNYGDLYLQSTSILQYDDNDNLRKIIESYDNNSLYKTVYSYDDYDNKNNPYKNINVPFEEFIYLRFSKNNFLKYKKEEIVNGNVTTYKYETFSYNYNDKGYPDFAEYKCQ